MPRAGKGARTRETARSHAQTRLLNAELREMAESFTPQVVAKRASDRVYRVTGHRIASSAVFSAMGIRPVNGESSRGQWLTARAMSQSVSTDRRTDDERRTAAHTARERRESQPSVHAMRKTVRRMEAETRTACALLAQQSVWDEAYFAMIFIELARRMDESGDQQRMAADLRDLALRREASREWEDDLLAKIHANVVTVPRLRAIIDARRKNDVRNGRAPVALADCPLWDTHPVTPVRATRPVRPVVLTAVAPAVDHAQEIMHDNKYFTRGTD